MGICAFFHKIKIWLIRKREPFIPYVNSKKRYGSSGEDEFIHMLRHYLPSCEIKRNILISTPDGVGEMDFLVLYENKLFAFEIKRWKGIVIEQEDFFVQLKTDRWTNETHTKHHKSPFKQLGRSIYLLRKQIPTKVWINDIVFFVDDGLESVELNSNKICFCDYQRLANYMHNDGKSSFENNARYFFEKCVCADYIYSSLQENFLPCIINRSSLCFYDSLGKIPTHNIDYIRIYHHWYYDEIHIKLLDGTERITTTENTRIQINDGRILKSYSLSKIDCIFMGNTIK